MNTRSVRVEATIDNGGRWWIHGEFKVIQLPASAAIEFPAFISPHINKLPATQQMMLLAFPMRHKQGKSLIMMPGIESQLSQQHLHPLAYAFTSCATWCNHFCSKCVVRWSTSLGSWARLWKIQFFALSRKITLRTPQSRPCQLKTQISIIYVVDMTLIDVFHV